MHFFKKSFTFIKKHKILSVVGIIIIAILIFIFRPKSSPPLDNITVKRTHLVQSVSVSGTIVAKNQANLSFISSGLVTYIGAKPGDTVTAGQTIAVLDQRTVLKNLQNSLLSYSLQRNTFDQNVAANGNRTNPTDAVNDAMKRIIQNNQYNLDQAVVSVELQDLARQQSILTAPFTGIVTQAGAVAVGATVSPTTIFTITDPTSLVFSMDVDEADIGKIAVGQNVTINLDAYPTMTSSYPVNRIDFISHTTSTGGNAFTVEVKLPANAATTYRVGMNGNADITTAEKENVLTIPIASIINNNQVYIKTATGYEKRTITTGLQTDVDTEVTSGLQAGDVVITQPSAVPAQTKGFHLF